MDNRKKGETATSAATEYAAVKQSEEKAMEAALAAEVTITLEKRPGVQSSAAILKRPVHQRL